MITVWIPAVIFYLGLFDAALIMVAGLLGFAFILTGFDANKFWDRAFPAGGILLLSNVVAAVVLFAVRAMIG